jgi:hypothetical protein
MNIDDIISLVDRYRTIQNQVLAKLTIEEKEVLGLN